jgi:hypothetical protein
MSISILVRIVFTTCVACASFAVADDQAPSISFVKQSGQLDIHLRGERIASYCYEDAKIWHPFFANLRTAEGHPVTRTYPPVAGTDDTDHDTIHPGLWLAFGDVGGADFWRPNKDRVRHERFVEEPQAVDERATFAVGNRYETAAGKTMCNETARFTIQEQPQGYLIVWDSTFSNREDDFYFGDQEEMGLGVRVATPMTVTRGGTIRDSDGRTNEPEIWGKSAAWCDYSGAIDGRRVGVTLMDHPGNFRPNWYHARNYGVLAANAFGRQAFGKGETSRVVVKQGEEFRLRYGVFIHDQSAEAPFDVAAAYNNYLRLYP